MSAKENERERKKPHGNINKSFTTGFSVFDLVRRTRYSIKLITRKPCVPTTVCRKITKCHEYFLPYGTRWGDARKIEIKSNRKALRNVNSCNDIRDRKWIGRHTTTNLCVSLCEFQSYLSHKLIHRWWHSISSLSSTLNRLWDCLNNDFVVTMIVSCLVISTPQSRMPQQAFRRYADDVCRQMMSLRDELSPIYSSTLYVIVCITSSEISLLLRPKTMMILQKISCLMTLTQVVCVCTVVSVGTRSLHYVSFHDSSTRKRRRWNNFVVSLCAAKWDDD